MTKRMSLLIRKLALGGGGAKGILHIGVLREVAKHQPLEFPDGIYGSSVGSIIASCIAFRVPIDNILNFVKQHSSIQSMIPSKFDVKNISKLFANKGLYSMEVFDQRMIELFKSANIDIEKKKLKDAHMPLYVVSSNITKGIPAIFSDDVFVLEALRCSCSIPFLFHPQQVGSNLYVDGDILTPNLTTLCPEDTIIINLDKHRKNSITPSQLESLSPLEYARDLYLIVATYNQKNQSSSNTFSISYPDLYSDTDLSQMNTESILVYASDQFRRFFGTHVLGEEISEL
jgi:predicted acylesterase/phospholipase RssA